VNNTKALCNVCYKEIDAVADPFPESDNVPMIYKTCPEHGLQRGVLEGDRDFFNQFNGYNRINHYKVLIINVTDVCNIKCKHCYYPTNKKNWHMPLDQFKTIITVWRGRMEQFIISGGDATCWEHYFEAAAWCKEKGVTLSQLTNGVKFYEDDFWNKAVEHYSFDFHEQKYMAMEMSIHPTNISSPRVREAQIGVLCRLREAKMRQSCIMMNIDTDVYDLKELDKVMDECVDFIQQWQDVTCQFRVRPICFDAWGKGSYNGAHYHLSDLVKSMYRVTQAKGLSMEYSFSRDVDNIYNQNFTINGVQVVTVCAGNIRALDLGYLNRGPFMLANDGGAYSVPHAIIINEGIDKGWYGGCKC
jgi:uncharacterized radical SAM superfamily Fe-S cluster-containing enzyme